MLKKNKLIIEKIKEIDKKIVEKKKELTTIKNEFNKNIIIICLVFLVFFIYLECNNISDYDRTLRNIDNSFNALLVTNQMAVQNNIIIDATKITDTFGSGNDTIINFYITSAKENEAIKDAILINTFFIGLLIGIILMLNRLGENNE